MCQSFSWVENILLSRYDHCPIGSLCGCSAILHFDSTLLGRVKKLNKHLYPGSCFFGPKEKLITLSAKFCQGADILRSKVILNLKSTLSVQVDLDTKVTTIGCQILSISIIPEHFRKIQILMINI